MWLTLPVALAASVFMFTMGFLPAVDPDFFWHEKIGELIRNAGAIPAHEVFSHTAQGRPWVVQGWLSDVVLDYVWKSSGIVGLRLLVASVLLLTLTLSYRTARLYSTRAETALFLTILSFFLLLPAIAPRPTMVTVLGTALTLYSLLAFRRRGGLRQLLILPAVFALWPNLHFGYIVGVGLVGLFVLSDLLARVAPLGREHREERTLLGLGPALIGLLCAVAIGANPYGYGVLSETVTMSIQGATSRVAEWQSPSFALFPGKMVYLAIGVFIVARSFARRSIHWIDLVVPLVFIGAALSALRHIALMGIVLSPFVARALQDWDPVEVPFAMRPGRPTSKIASRELGSRVTSLLNVALVACVAASTALIAPRVDLRVTDARARLQPSGAADFILSNRLRGRLFNTYNGGGYLIYRLYPTQRVFIDGRYNVYPEEVIDGYFSIVDGGPDWFTKLQNYGIDIVVTENDVAFRQLMLSRAEFRLVYVDRYYSVLVRDIDRFHDLPTVESAMAPMQRHLSLLSKSEFASEVVQ